MDDDNTTENTDADVDTEQVDAPEAETDTEEAEETEAFDSDKAREKIRKINSENRNLRKRATEAEAKATSANDSGERVTTLEAENLRLRIGVKHGLPEKLVKRLSGTTEAEILQDAEELMELFGGRKPPSQQPQQKLRGGGDPTQQEDQISDLDKFAEDIFKN
jgi:hypothetical protein